MHLPKGKLRNLIIGDFSGDPEWSVMSLAGFGLAIKRLRVFSSKSGESHQSGARFFSRAYVHGCSMLKAEENSYAQMIQKSRISQ